jgi:leucyl aminopeptidase (aminopeptidase T)
MGSFFEPATLQWKSVITLDCVRLAPQLLTKISVSSACFLDNPDPVTEWKKLSQAQERITTYLDGKSTLYVVGKDTNLRATIRGRKWVNADGH